MVAVPTENSVAKGAVEVSYGGIMNVGGVEAVPGGGSGVGQPVPKRKSIFGECGRWHDAVDIGTIGESKHVCNLRLIKLVFSAEQAECCDACELVGGSGRCNISEAAEEF